MAHELDHQMDCIRILGEACADVHRWLDQAFQRFGPRHRFVKHHAEGVAKAAELFGERGRKAAIIHILRDCGHIPTEKMYQENEVDVLGFDPDSNFNGFWNPIEFDAKARELLGIEVQPWPK